MEIPIKVVSILDNPFKIESTLTNSYTRDCHNADKIDLIRTGETCKKLHNNYEEIITIFSCSQESPAPSLLIQPSLNLAGPHKSNLSLTPLYIDKSRRLSELEKDSQKNINNNYLELSEFSDLLEIDCEKNVNMNDEDLKNIAKSCPNLEKIDLTNCKNITDIGLEYLLRNCKNLHILNITRCHQIITIGMEYIGLLPFLYELILFSCEKITENTLENMLMRCPNLHSINLGNCQQISDNTLHNLSKYSKNLKLLNISWCWKITNFGLIEILRNCTKIIELILKYCCNINDDSLKSLKNLPDLEILDLSYNSNITDRSLIILGLGCLNLKNINLINSFQKCELTKDGIQYIKEKCINLEKINYI
jgi:F-box/leucine-rich repeat protein 2/20